MDKTGEYLKAQFKSVNLIYQDAADYLGVSVAYIGALITGRNPINMRNAVKLHDFLDSWGCDVSEFYYYMALRNKMFGAWAGKLTKEQIEAIK